MVLGSTSCAPKKEDTTKTDKPSSSSEIVVSKEENTKNLFESNKEPWKALEIGDNMEVYKFAEQKEFNVIRFDEEGKKVDNVKVEAMVDGNFKEIYNQDEMGKRAGVVDTIKTNEVRVTITSSKEGAKVNSIKFDKVDKIARANEFRVASYVVGPFTDKTESSFDGKLKLTTDAILIGSIKWDEKGNLIIEKGMEKLEADINLLKKGIKDTGSKAKIWLCVGGYKGDKANEGEIFATPEARANFIKQTLDLVVKHNLAGVDIDYEYPNSKTQWDNYSQLIVELKTEYAKKKKQLSLAMAAWGITLTPEAIASIDQVQIMLYDAFDNKDRHAPYSVVEQGINYFKELGFPLEKLNAGLALYGREMPKDARTERWPSYAGMQEKFKDSFTKNTNSIDGSYFSGVTMNCDKTFLAIEKGIGGIMTWHYACDLPFTSELSIYKGVNDTMNRFIK
ncbi:MAG: glycoside hydrolase family 18 protein [Clostridia bacterium]